MSAFTVTDYFPDDGLVIGDTTGDEIIIGDTVVDEYGNRYVVMMIPLVGRKLGAPRLESMVLKLMSGNNMISANTKLLKI